MSQPMRELGRIAEQAVIEAAEKILILAAERWPEFRDIQAILGPPIAKLKEIENCKHELGHYIAQTNFEFSSPCPKCGKILAHQEVVSLLSSWKAARSHE